MKFLRKNDPLNLRQLLLYRLSRNPNARARLVELFQLAGDVGILSSRAVPGMTYLESWYVFGAVPTLGLKHLEASQSFSVNSFAAKMYCLRSETGSSNTHLPSEDHGLPKVILLIWGLEGIIY